MCADTYSNERTKQTVRNKEVSVLSSAFLYFYCETKILGVVFLSGNHLLQNSKKRKRKTHKNTLPRRFVLIASHAVAVVSEQLQLVVINPFFLYTLSFLS